MRGNVFNKYFLSDYISNVGKVLSNEIDSLEITDTTDLYLLTENLELKYTIQPIELLEAIPSKPKETTRKIQNHWGETYEQKVFEIFVKIPFNGQRELFDCFPSTSGIVYLDKGVNINRSDITATITLDNLDATKFNSAVSKIKSELNRNIPRINSEIEPWNKGLSQLITRLIENRKGVVSEKMDFMKAIGLNVNPHSDSFVASKPVVRKNIPKPVSETSKRKDITPYLQEQVYNDIKEIIYNVGKSIERKQSLYKGKHEEDLRDVFLLFLETRYDSTTGVGEAFNKKGKTDILLKYANDGTNLFVAECKFWKGKKSLLSAIDQLLGYLTHRDSKTALMMFVNQNEITSVMETAKKEIKEHSNFKRFVNDSYESSFSYEFTLPEDSKKIIQIELMFFHFPK
ncbi:hypothetical protein [Algibacter sp. R77976]|uniref:hypothetical protein n=1 Tax=Algibacter sp. R77976 TaxID=3093873 RepID=UPI0037CBD3E9